ncbi:pyruvate:ferredoxin (flavodoxin) oxidoreductase [uncultured Dysosmobacter sp.]|uniref:pyruvate:ferredoxin (flavodoxin) oxidoreductase n=1 Tax=uncultured Dysosmobacter sp. TaxID=2591384 RepID=UPI00345DAC11
MMKRKTMDGNEAAAYASYAFTEVATIYPITPSSPMAEHVDTWAANGMKNLFGQPVRLVEMQSEAGACGAMHGSLEAGALTTSYTASQGLMLMIPPLYRISGQLLPGVIHVAARTVGTSAFSIFGDHSDVMACRQTGFAQLASSCVQECMDLAAVAHLSAIKARVPFMHFFDGFRTSHEIQKIEVLDYEDLRSMLDTDAVDRFRANALNSEHPLMRSTVINPDTAFQLREAVNPYYDAVPGIVEDYMAQMSALTGRDYKLFNYYGDPEAEEVVIAMGSVSGCLQEVVKYLNERGRKVGFLQVRLYRPFSAEHFLKALPESCRRLTVLDRTKEPGANGEPLYEDVCAVLLHGQRHLQVLGGRYGLSSKDTTPAQMIAVYDNMEGEQKNHFTVGITDDVTFHSLPVGENVVTADARTISCKFWGLGSDGTVGANKNSIKIIGDNTDQYVQAYFEYDTKKSGGVTKSHLRFGHTPILSTYYVTMADFVACHNQSYIAKYDIVNEIKEGGTFLLNCGWSDEDLERHLPNKVKRLLAQRHVKFYTIDATRIAGEIGLGNRTNSVLQSAFFKLSGVLPTDQAVEYMKDAIKKTYGRKGDKVVAMNCAAVDAGLSGIHEIHIPEHWAALTDEAEPEDLSSPYYVRTVMKAVNAQKGDSLPVSVFKDAADGTVPMATSKYEKRGFASQVASWLPENCIGCNLCSLVCPHAAIRPFLLNEEEVEKAPEDYVTKEAKGRGFQGLRYRIQVDPLDCTGCGSCAAACIAKDKAIVMKPIESQLPEQPNWDYSLALSPKPNPMSKFTVKGSQYEQPLLEFSGACAGCGETPYMKLLTQLFGERMVVANATGCTQAWGFSVPSYPYTTKPNGRGPALSNSLFENNAEYSLGMVLSVRQQRLRLAQEVRELADETKDEALKAALQAWLDGFEDKERTIALSDAVIEALRNCPETGELIEKVRRAQDQLVKKSMWMYGGDGWAYDIGYGGLDHVLASGEDVNILVVDTEVYSNTGGQASKATPLGAVAQFAASGKKTEKKDLGMLAAQYQNVYVASVALGADPAQYIRALKEAEAHNGPSLIVAYAPCINHGIVKGMAFAQEESKLAVKSGYWVLYRYDPKLRLEGKNPFTLDFQDPKYDLREFLMGEVRFNSLQRTFPEKAEALLTEARTQCRERWARYNHMANQDYSHLLDVLEDYPIHPVQKGETT